MLFCSSYMLQQVSCFFDDRYHDTSLFLMNKLRPGQQVVGPAIIIDQNRSVLPAVYKHVCQVDKPYCNKQQLIDILWILYHVVLMSRAAPVQQFNRIEQDMLYCLFHNNNIVELSVSSNSFVCQSKTETLYLF